jgi:hypothetical protein
MAGKLLEHLPTKRFFSVDLIGDRSYQIGQLLRMWHGQRPKYDRIEQTENCGIGAITKARVAITTEVVTGPRQSV